MVVFASSSWSRDESLHTVARLWVNWLLCDEGADALCSSAQFGRSCDVPRSNPPAAVEGLGHDAALVLNIMDGLVHEGFDKVALVSCVTHRAKIEHEFHDVEVLDSVACLLAGLRTDADMSSCGACVGSCEDYIQCSAAHVDVVSKDAKSGLDDALNHVLQWAWPTRLVKRIVGRF